MNHRETKRVRGVQGGVAFSSLCSPLPSPFFFWFLFCPFQSPFYPSRSPIIFSLLFFLPSSSPHLYLVASSPTRSKIDTHRFTYTHTHVLVHRHTYSLISLDKRKQRHPSQPPPQPTSTRLRWRRWLGWTCVCLPLLRRWVVHFVWSPSLVLRWYFQLVV